MCGIFGFIGKPNLRTLRRIASATETRGPHAFGFAWINCDGRLRSYKQEGRITDSLGLLSIACDAVALIGHCRWTTVGHQSNNINNHPHPCDGGWMVHNGTVFNHMELASEYDLHQSSECDSETLACLIESMPGETDVARVRDAVNETEGPLAMAALWNRPSQLVVARRGKPLFESSNRNAWYFASQPVALPGNVREVANGRVFSKRI